MNFPEIKPIQTVEYESKQSKYEHCGKLPIRSIILGPSGSGKTVLLVNMILDIYKKCFNRVYIFSPSIRVDTTWGPVKSFIAENDLCGEDETCLFDHYNPEDLNNIIETQRKIIELMKSQKRKKLYQILIIADDFADDPTFSRNSKLLHSLFTRGRHSMISTIVATQKFSAIHPIIRTNATELYVYRLRNYKDLESFLEELSALYDKKTLLKLYEHATDAPYSFLYVKLTAKTKDQMFFMNLNKRLTVEHSEEN